MANPDNKTDEYGDVLGTLKADDVVDYRLQKHHTHKKPKNPHLDLRLGTINTGLYSWAIPGGELPEAGKKKLAPQTPVHPHSYGTFSGPLRSGYGKGRVELAESGAATISKVTPASVHFTVTRGNMPVRYALIKVKKGNERDWLLIRKSEDKPPVATTLTATDTQDAVAQVANMKEATIQITGGKIKLAGADIEIGATVTSTDGAEAVLRILGELHRTGMAGHSHSVVVDPDSKEDAVSVGWDGDGSDHISALRIGKRKLSRKNMKALLAGNLKLKDCAGYTPEAKTAADSKGGRSYSCVMIELKGDSAKKLLKFGKSIPKSELQPPDDDTPALETDPHITIKYGLLTESSDRIKKALKEFGPAKVKLGKVSIFSGEDYDVVKVGVTSAALRKMRKPLDAMRNGDKYPDYKPHATIAYVKKGEGKKYVGRTDLEGVELTLDTIDFSDKNNNHTFFKLTGTEKKATLDYQRTTPGESEKDISTKDKPTSRYTDAQLTASKYGEFKRKKGKKILTGKSPLRIMKEAVEAKIAKVKQEGDTDWAVYNEAETKVLGLHTRPEAAHKQDREENGDTNGAAIARKTAQTNTPDYGAMADYVAPLEDFSPAVYNDPGRNAGQAIGYGHNITRNPDLLGNTFPDLDMDAIRGGTATLTQPQARTLLEQHDLPRYYQQAQGWFPNLGTYPQDVQNVIASSTFRGMMGDSPDTRRLINAGDWSGAADEYLEADDYRNAIAPGSRTAGVAPRMQQVSDAFRTYGTQLAAAPATVPVTDPVTAPVTPPAAPVAAPTPVAAPAAPVATEYTIQNGDNLSTLAQQYGVTVAELLQLNPTITDPNRIQAGQTINVPATEKTEAAKLKKPPALKVEKAPAVDVPPVGAEAPLPPQQALPPKPPTKIGSADTVKLIVTDKEGNAKAELDAEIADTLLTRRIGLSKRAELPAGRGMFFDKIGAYWMKDVEFPLDIVFLSKNGSVLEKQHMPQLIQDADQAPLYESTDKTAAHALELPAGWFDEQGIVPGDRLQVALRLPRL